MPARKLVSSVDDVLSRYKDELLEKLPERVIFIQRHSEFSDSSIVDNLIDSLFFVGYSKESEINLVGIRLTFFVKSFVTN